MQGLSAVIPYIHIGLSILLIVLILMQQTDASLGAVFGGGYTTGSGRTRRGFEMTLFKFTIGVAIVFSLVSLLAFLYT